MQRIGLSTRSSPGFRCWRAGPSFATRSTRMSGAAASVRKMRATRSPIRSRCGACATASSPAITRAPIVEAAQRRPETPRVSPAQWEALDLLSELADELALDMSFAPGDIQFVNNHVIYHARTAFEDDAAAGRDRLLLRLWMAMPNSRALPAGHEVLWGRIEAGAPRGGIGQTAAAPLR